MTSHPTDVAPAVSRLERTLLEAESVVFGAFHQPRLHLFLQQVHTVVDQHEAAGGRTIDREAFLRQAGRDLLAELGILAGRSLVARFHEFRTELGIPAESSRNDAYARFSEQLAVPAFRDAVEQDLPTLTQLLDAGVQHRVRLVTEILGALRADLPALERAGLAHPGPLTSITISSGDAHNGGRKVAIVAWSGGKVVYKPRRLGPDQAFADAVAAIRPHLDPDIDLRLPGIVHATGGVDATDHGWQEFVQHRPMTAFEQIARHRYRLGAFLALFTGLGATDLHLENLISDGEHPLFIDLETLLQQRPPTGPAPAEAAGLDATEPDPTAQSPLRCPLLDTMLLPMRIADSSLDVDMSGIGRPGGQTSQLASFSLLDPASDAVRFERATFEVRHGDNLARIGDVPVPPAVGLEDLLAGFRDGVTAVRLERDRLLSIVAESGAQVRQVVRATHIYARFLLAATHPRYLADPASRGELLGKMAAPTGVLPSAARAVADREHRALVRGDVPYFTVDLTTTDLHTPADGTVREAFPTSVLDHVRASLEDLVGSPYRRHEHTIRMSLATTHERFALSAADARPAPAGYASELFGDQPVADSVARFLTDTAHRAGGRPLWLLPLLTITDAGEGLVFRPGELSLYEGGGAPLALATVASLLRQAEPSDRTRVEESRTARRRWAGLALDSAPDPVTVPAADTPRGMSFFAGLGGAAFLAHELGVHLGDPDLLRRRDAFLSSIIEHGPRPVGEAPTDLDLMGGPAGTAAYLATVLESAPDLSYAGAAQHFLDLALTDMLRLLRHGVLPATGLAHGDLGIAWSALRCAAVLDDVTALKLAGDVIVGRARELAAHGSSESLPEVADSSWCKGTAGALVALAEAYPLVERADAWLLDALVETGTAQVLGRGRDLTPCHGVSGFVQALVRAARILDRPDLHERAREVFADRVARVPTQGYGAGLAHGEGFVGYMLGLSGVAHTELLLEQPDWGSPLWISPTPLTPPDPQSAPRARR